MRTAPWKRLGITAICSAVLVSCGGGGDSAPAPAAEPVDAYLRDLPQWDAFSPALAPVSQTRVEPTTTTSERIDNVPVIEGTGPDAKVIGYRSEQYTCDSSKYSMTQTPEKIVMFSPDRELMWPGALIQGKSHRDGLGSLLPLTIHERTPIKVSIPSLATTDNFRVVESPDQAEVNQAIGSMVLSATTDRLATPSTIQFSMRDYSSDESFALQAGMSGRYLGFSGSASAKVSTSANERTVMVYFFEKMFEVVVEPPQSPGSFFTADFTRDKLDEQVAMGRMGPNNPPVYVSNIVYGRTMAFTFTSTASSTEIKAALSAAYSGIFKAKLDISSEHLKVLSEGKVAITSLGGSSTATTAMIASGDWRQYFTQEPTPLTTAYPISYTLRNLGDGSIAKVSESTEYTIKQCVLQDAVFSGFVLDSFESDFASVADANKKWVASVGAPLQVAWGSATTPQSIFYGYLWAKHQNLVDNDLFKYDVGYVTAPQHFRGDKSDFYKGELSFWFKPDDNVYTTTTGLTTHCYWLLWPFFKTCVLLQTPFTDKEALKQTDEVLAYDNITTFDQVVLRGGGAAESEIAVLTLTYNPTDVGLAKDWQKRTFALTNDSLAGNSLCDKTSGKPKGCWLVEDEEATEEQIKYVLANIRELRIRASYPVTMTRKVCADNPPPTLPAICATGYVDTLDAIPFGYVGGYFDEVQINKRSPGL